MITEYKHDVLDSLNDECERKSLHRLNSEDLTPRQVETVKIVSKIKQLRKDSIKFMKGYGLKLKLSV
jgi:hypothetical protein